MATKKQAASTAVVEHKPTGGALTTWESRLAAAASKAVEQEKGVGTGNFITSRGGILTYQGNPLADNTLMAVVIDSISERNFYEEAWDPDNPAVPACFAFGRDDSALTPHEGSKSPQHATCKGCPQDEWGTATDARGKPRAGKACQQRRKLMLVPADVLQGGADAIARSEVAYYKMPVTSVKGWAAYVKTLAATYKRPPFAFVTKLKLVQDAEVQQRMTFNVEAGIEDPALLDALVAKAEAHVEEMTRPYEEIAVKEKPAAAARGPRKYK